MMFRYSFSIFLFFTFGIVFYGGLVDLFFPVVANEFNFYYVHNNIQEIMGAFFIGFLLCIISRNFAKSIFFGGCEQTSTFDKFTTFLRTKGPLLGLFSGMFFFAIDGVTFLPERLGYVIESDIFFSTLYAVSGMCGLACIPLLALAWSSSNGMLRKICFFVFILVLCCYFAKASRVFVLGIIIYLITSNYSGLRLSKYLLILILLSTPFSMSFIYELRGQTVQGFIPFLYFLFNGQSEYSLSDLFFDFFISFSSSYYIFIETVNRAYWIDFKDIWVSLNPQFGGASGWVNVFEEYRIVEAVPYSSMGEIIAYSSNLFYFLCFVFGVTFARAEFNYNVGRVIGVAQISILIYMAILMPQYNLRSIFRFFYLVIALDLLLVANAFLKVFFNFNKRNRSH